MSIAITIFANHRPQEASQMATLDITKDNFEETITKDGVVLVDFWASWCGPCKSFAPVFEETSNENPEAVFAKVDTEAEQELAGALGIQSIPTIMIFRDGIQVFSQPGALPKDALDDLLEQVNGLDMEEVRKEVEAHAANHEHGPSCNH